MSTPTTGRRRGRLVGVLATLAAALGLFLSVTGSASAAVTCTFDDVTNFVNIVINDAVPPFNNDIVVKRSGQVITVAANGGTATPCSDGFGVVATVINTDQINVTPSPAGAFGDDTLTIDLTGGPFSPGFIIEGPASLNEIEWFVNLGEGNNGVRVLGSNAAEGVVGGQNGALTNWDGLPVTAANGDGPFAIPAYQDVLLNLNAGVLTDDDADVWIVTTNGSGQNGAGICGAVSLEDCLLATLELDLDGGDNTVFLKGGDGTGAALCDLGTNPFTFDTIFGPLPNDRPITIITGAGNDNIIGSECSDTIQSGGGNDFVDGNGPDFGDFFCFQDDILAVYEPSDQGVGDIVDFTGVTADLTITINEDGSITITGATLTVVGVEGIIGGSGNDTITGNSQSNLLGGGDGNDTISGLGGDDVLLGGAGDDTLLGGLGEDCVIGGEGNDTLDENAPLDADGNPAYGPLGNGADALDGGPGVDTVLYDKRGRADGQGNVVVYLGLISTFNDGADPNHDGLTNEFDDVFFTTENVKTGSNDDLVSANFTNNRANNVITDGDGNDCVEGGPGNDSFDQAAAPNGADVILGNTGADLANYGGRTDAVAVSLDGVANDGDIATNEGDMVGGFSVSCRPATVIVNPPVGILIDLFGDDSILNDLNFLDAPIPGPAPNCFLFQLPDLNGAGRQQQGDGIFFCDPGEQVGGDASPLSDVDVENVDGGAGNDILVGDDSGNVLNGGGGNDQISGNASTDQLNGGDGDDTINPGSGNDAVDGGAGTNTVDYASAGAGGVGVQVSLATGTASGDGNDTLANIQNVIGTSFADGITGDDNANTIAGRGGSDKIQGKGGDDNLQGGAGNDQIASGAGADTVAGDIGNDAIQGGANNDRLQGGPGRDTILGQKGNDRLFGNAQPDFLNGGPGRDLCRPGSPGLARGDVVVNCEA